MALNNICKTHGRDKGLWSTSVEAKSRDLELIWEEWVMGTNWDINELRGIASKSEPLTQAEWGSYNQQMVGNMRRAIKEFCHATGVQSASLNQNLNVVEKEKNYLSFSTSSGTPQTKVRMQSPNIKQIEKVVESVMLWPFESQSKWLGFWEMREGFKSWMGVHSSDHKVHDLSIF